MDNPYDYQTRLTWLSERFSKGETLIREVLAESDIERSVRYGSQWRMFIDIALTGMSESYDMLVDMLHEAKGEGETNG
jgi:hypothetical protein